MQEHVRKVLEQPNAPRQLQDLLVRVRDLVKMSRDTMSGHYDRWDDADRVYRGERLLDEKDKQAARRGEPVKCVIPLSYAQIQTFASFMSTLFMQRDYVFELAGSGAEDERPAQLGQAVVERDLEYNAFRGVLFPQFAVDVGRFGLGIFKSGWTRKTCPKMVEVPDPNYAPVPGLPIQAAPPMVMQMQEVTEYLGNIIRVVSPYRWFPDTRLPLTRYREGEFCADELEYSIAELRKDEQLGAVAGLSHIPRANTTMVKDRRPVVLTDQYIQTQPENDSRYVLITEVQIRLNPAKTEIADGVVLDENIDSEVIYIIWIANDSRIIKIADSGYDHNQFTYDAAQFFNDQNRILNFGLAEKLGPLQDINDWLMNSRLANVRKVINNQVIYDPRYIDMEDVYERKAAIRLKSSTNGLSIDTVAKQLNVTDVTTGHITDMQLVQGFAKDATGITENLLGQYASGRRSAREASNVNSNAAARLIIIAQGLWDSAMLPLGKKLLSNIRQGLDEDQLIRVVGLSKIQTDPVAAQAFLPVNRTLLYGTYDFLVFNATLPSQRAADAMALQELLVAGQKDPRLWFVLGLDPQLVAFKVLELRGIQNVEQFRLSPDRAQLLMLLAGAGGNAGSPQPAQGPSGAQ